VAATDEGKMWHAGESYIFANPEFSDVTDCANVFALLDEFQRLHELFFVRSQGLSPIEILFGEELGWPELRPVGVITTHFNAGGKKGVLGVIGPARLSYPTIIPIVRYFKNLIEEVANK
jgi:heat-inducible transcriptional repressor